MAQVLSAAKYPLHPKVTDFAKTSSCAIMIDLFYVNSRLLQIKTFPLFYAASKSEVLAIGTFIFKIRDFYLSLDLLACETNKYYFPKFGLFRLEKIHVIH